MLSKLSLMIVLGVGILSSNGFAAGEDAACSAAMSRAQRVADCVREVTTDHLRRMAENNREMNALMQSVFSSGNISQDAMQRQSALQQKGAALKREADQKMADCESLR